MTPSRSATKINRYLVMERAKDVLVHRRANSSNLEDVRRKERYCDVALETFSQRAAHSRCTMTTPPPKPSLTVDTGSGTMNSPVSSDEPNSTFFTPYGSSRGDDDEADEDRFLQRVFESTDAACQGFVHSGCDTRLDDQFDTFMVRGRGFEKMERPSQARHHSP